MRLSQSHSFIKLAVVIVAFIITLCLVFTSSAHTLSPSRTSAGYFQTESASDYEKYNYAYEDWETYVPSEDEIFTTSPGYVALIESFETNTPTLSTSDYELIMLSESEAWQLVSGGIFNAYPTSPYKEVKADVKKIYEEQMSTITVKVWYWANPKDDTDMTKITTTKTFTVNRQVADLFKHAFEDIYAHPSRPVINIGDAGMGTWVLRGKNHNDNNTLSAHGLGTAIDINPSTGSFYVDGVWYGNAYKQKAMPYSIWQQLPETHKKYHVLYVDCPIVSIFKSYGFYWGGDWKTGTDCMHLAFLGDGSSARKTGQSNYYKYGGK